MEINSALNYRRQADPKPKHIQKSIQDPYSSQYSYLNRNMYRNQFARFSVDLQQITSEYKTFLPKIPSTKSKLERESNISNKISRLSKIVEDQIIGQRKIQSLHHSERPEYQTSSLDPQISSYVPFYQMYYNMVPQIAANEKYHEEQLKNNQRQEIRNQSKESIKPLLLCKDIQPQNSQPEHKPKNEYKVRIRQKETVSQRKSEHYQHNYKFNINKKQISQQDEWRLRQERRLRLNQKIFEKLKRKTVQKITIDRVIQKQNHSGEKMKKLAENRQKNFHMDVVNFRGPERKQDQLRQRFRNLLKN